MIVGDFDPSKVMELLKKYYGPIPRQDRPARDIADESEQNGERRLVMHDDVGGERLLEAYHVGSARDDDSYALDVLSEILFDGTNSRGNRLLVEDTEVALGVSGTNFTPTYPGLFMISASLQKGRTSAQAEEKLERLIHEVQEKGVTAEEVKSAVRQLTVQMVDSVRTPYGLGSLIGTVQVILGDPKEFGSDLAKYLKVRPEDVKRVAQKYLIPNNRSVVTMTPKQTLRKPPNDSDAIGFGRFGLFLCLKLGVRD